jgi:membrane-associated phospholipid phosphatase
MSRTRWTRETTRLPPWAEVLGGALALGLGTTLIYRLLALLASHEGMLAPWWMNTPVERLVPFVPEAIWVYVSWYPAILLLVFTDEQTIRLGFVGFALAFAVCSVGHAMWPVTIERPFVDAQTGLSAGLLAWFYAFDPPRNLFPSFHAAGAGLVVALRPKGVVMSATVFSWAVALCASCVLIRQHFVVDVVVGFGVGVASAWCAVRTLAAPDPSLNRFRRTARSQKVAPRAHRTSVD